MMAWGSAVSHLNNGPHPKLLAPLLLVLPSKGFLWVLSAMLLPSRFRPQHTCTGTFMQYSILHFQGLMVPFFVPAPPFAPPCMLCLRGVHCPSSEGEPQEQEFVVPDIPFGLRNWKHHEGQKWYCWALCLWCQASTELFPSSQPVICLPTGGREGWGG